MTPRTEAPFSDELFGAEFWDHSPDIADALRARGPVHRGRLPNGVEVWVIGQYDAARAALADPRLSKDSSELSRIMRARLAAAGQPDGLSNMFGQNMLFADGRRHARLRSLVAAEFTGQRVGQMRPRLEAIADALIDRLPVGVPVDLIEAVAFPFPLAVICELLGVPEHLRNPLRRWTAELMEDRQERSLPASAAMERCFAELIADKRATPGEDLLSALVQLPQDEGGLTDTELMSSIFLLFVAGHETTTNLLGHAVRHMLSEPDRWRALARDCAAIPPAVEEILRWRSPVRMATHRFTAEEVEIAGTVIPAGEIVLVWLQCGNRDESRFPHGAQLQFDRDPRGKHLSFGFGVHYCLGAQLARLEAEVAISSLARRFPGTVLAVGPDGLRHRPSSIMDGLMSLPVLLAD